MSTIPQMHPADKLPRREQAVPMPSAQLCEKHQAELDPPPIPFRKREAIELVEQASRSSDLDTISSLVHEHHLTSEDLQIALSWAVRGKQPQIIRCFLDQGVRIGRRAAVAAAAVRSLAVYMLLVEYGWDVNAPLAGGQTTLMCVVQDEALLMWFLNHGADPNIGAPYISVQSDSDSFPDSGDALNLAAGSSSIAAFDLLLAHGAKLENSLPLHAAATRSDADAQIPMMRHLLSLGVDVNASDAVKGPRRGGTPLHHAAYAGRIKAVQFLVENGADLDAKSPLGMTPLQEARRWGQAQVVWWLEKASMGGEPGGRHLAT